MGHPHQGKPRQRRHAARLRDQPHVGAQAGDVGPAVAGRLRLEHVANNPAAALSGGQKKLLELGRILMLKPRCVLLDEPYAGVNPVLIEQISERIRELHARGIGFVIVEHNLNALSRLVERMLVLDGGKLLAEGTPEAVLADPRVQAAYMGT